MFKIKNFSLVLAAFAYVLVACSQLVIAQQPNQLTVTPAFINVELSDANVQQKTQIAITNTYASNIELTASLKGIDEIGGKLVPAGDIEPELNQAIKLSQTELTAVTKETTILEVSVLNLPSLSTGGHYASLVLSQKPKNGQQSAYTSQISISIFIVKIGGERRSVDAGITASNQNIFRPPSQLTVVFKNTGNTHITPRASVLVTTTTGQLVAKGVANTASQPLLPGKSISSAISLKKTRFLWMPQKLKQTISFRVDGSDAVKNQQKNFWYIPPVFLMLLVAIPLVVYGVYRYAKILFKNRNQYLHTLKNVQLRKKKPVEIPVQNEELALAVASEFEPSEKDVLAVHVDVKKPKKAAKKTKKTAKKSKPTTKKKPQKNK
jgi:hypothetical protein